MKTFLILILVIAAATGGWHLGKQSPPETSGRKVLYYQSPMHPWIKSDKPGRCTVCGMQLSPVYEGDAGFDAGGNRIILSHDSVTVTHVDTVPVTRRTLRRSIRVAGMIDDNDSTHRRLSATVDGRIEKLFVNYVGAEVEAGQPLAALYSPTLRTVFGEYQLVAHQPASDQREKLLTGLRERLLRLGLPAKELEQAATSEQVPVELKVLSPIEGTVVKREVYEGQYVKEGTVLFEVADFSKMWFVFDAYERDLPWVRVGDEVEVTIPALPDRKFKAPIAFIDPNLNPDTRSAKIRVVLDNPLSGDAAKHRHELLHKLYAEGRIFTESAPTLTVSRSAVVWPAGRPIVYVEIEPGVYEPREVQIGSSGDEVWEIAGGLKEGDRVVTTGNLLLDSQARINHPAETASPPPSNPLPESQQQAALDFFTAVAKLSEALASEQPGDFRTDAGQLARPAAALAAAFGDRVAKLVALAKLSDGGDLPAQRAAFFPLSEATADFALELRREFKGLESVRIFVCDMTRERIPGAKPERGRWVQVKGDARNPWWGAEMITCGAEVRP
jgi:Cu(I)/Ag(I) efflux system membrane fusion protein